MRNFISVIIVASIYCLIYNLISFEVAIFVALADIVVQIYDFKVRDKN